MKQPKPMNEFALMQEEAGNLPLFFPNIPKKAVENVNRVLSGRWIGQGPAVDEFELEFSKNLNIENKSFIAVNSGTAALHLAYLLAGIGKEDDVICPVFTCTATNLPLIYVGANLKFYDVGLNSLNASIEDIQALITPETKAIVTVDYGGVPNDYIALRELADQHDIKIIADLAHCLDGSINGQSILKYVDFAIYSFQAIKTLTTADGGMLVCPDEYAEKAKRLRWFGIDRTEKQKGTWENDIYELGYKYQMTDIAASIGLAGLEELTETLNHRRRLLEIYRDQMKLLGLNPLLEGDILPCYDFTPWLATYICSDNRVSVMNALRDHGIESAQVHYRNDRYSIFKHWSDREFPNMDQIEENYLVLPLHTKMTENDVSRIVEVIASLQ